jgi:hypothetical protein
LEDFFHSVDHAFLSSLSLYFKDFFYSLTTSSSNVVQTVRKAREDNPVYIYKQGWKSIRKKYNKCQSKCKHTKGKPRSLKQYNEVEDTILKGHHLSQIS